MRFDSCNLTIRIRPTDQAAVVEAFGVEPAERHDLPDRPLCTLVFDDIQPHDPLADLARQGITFDGSHGDCATRPGRRFASLGGQLEAIDQPFGVVSVPVDLDSLAVDEPIFSCLRAYKSVLEQVREDFAQLPPIELPLAAFQQLEEVGDQEPWHRLLGGLSIGSVRFHVEAIAVQHNTNELLPQEAIAFGHARYLALISEAFGTDEGFQTVRLTASDGQDREYALFIYPHERW